MLVCHIASIDYSLFAGPSFVEISIFGLYERSAIAELTGEIEEIDIRYDEYSFVEPVRVVCRLHRDGDILRIEGTVFARIAGQCSRCLDPLVKETFGTFELVVKRLLLGEHVPPDTDRAEEMDGEQIVYVERHVTSFDITGYVRDAVILSLPLKVLCREDCGGLCPICGRNLNEGECGCSRTTGDPRWSTLAGMVGNTNEN